MKITHVALTYANPDTGARQVRVVRNDSQALFVAKAEAALGEVVAEEPISLHEWWA